MTTGSREPESGGVRTPPLFPFFLFFFCPFFRWNLGPHCRFFPPPRYTVLNSTSISGEVSCSAHSGRFSADSVSPLKEFISAGTFVISSSFFFFCHFSPWGGKSYHSSTSRWGRKTETPKELKHGNDHKFECGYMWILIDVGHNRIDQTINRELDQREIGCQIFW